MFPSEATDLNPPLFTLEEPAAAGSTSRARALALHRSTRRGRSRALTVRLERARRAVTDRYLFGQFRELQALLREAGKQDLSLAAEGPFSGYPRVLEIAAEMEASAQPADHFLAEYQSVAPLAMGELWLFDTMLRLAIFERYADAPDTATALLRKVNASDWQSFFEANSRTEQVLREDPAQVYAAMDFATRDRYRHVVEDAARHSSHAEEDIARIAVTLAQRASRGSKAGSLDEVREAHVGYYLIGKGLPLLRAEIAYRPAPRTRLTEAILAWPTTFYLIGIELVTFALAAYLLSFHRSHLNEIGLILFLLATEPAIALLNALTVFLIPPKPLPKMDFSAGISPDHATLVVVPTLLLSETFVNQLLADLEVRYLGNLDPQLTFALLTDFPDGASPLGDEALAEFCAAGVRRLNERYAADGRAPFYLFHRRREWNPQQSAWMGRERKRGKLIALNNLLTGADDVFPVKVGDLSILPRIRYVITLDSDTDLPRDSAQRLAATMAHPLNRAIIDSATNTVCEGYGILQPRVGVSVASATRSRLSAIYSGQTGFDLYSTAVSDVYQDLFEEGSYVGKGIYDVQVFQRVLVRRFPHNLLLSHDLIEGAYARAGLVSDIELIDDYPSHYSAWSKRKHRWVRGDWQITQWLLPRVPNYGGGRVPNPLSIISLWKVLDNLRRSIMEIAIFILLVAGWTFLPGGPVYWTTAVALVSFLPVYIGLLFSLLRTPINVQWAAHCQDAFSAFVSGNVEVALRFIFLAHQTCLMLDAIVRSLVRTTMTGRRLLEWESAAQSEIKRGARGNSIDRYLWFSTPLALLLAVAVAAGNRPALPAALPFLFAWFVSPIVALWLNASLARPREQLDRVFLRDVAQRTWQYFADFSTAEDSWLIPDNFDEETGAIAHRISPTNLGLLLNSYLAANDFGFVSVSELIDRLEHAFQSIDRMERHRGHFYNWYDTRTLAPLPPRYVSTVDSGNLAACLITLRQGLLELCTRPIDGPRDPAEALLTRMQTLAERAGELVAQMDFRFLFDADRKLLHIGFHVESGQLDESSYDLLASEARIASFIAIAKSDIPQENWRRLGRAHVLARGHKTLLSWSGTMFEYLMPLLWTKCFPNSLLDRATRAAVRCQCSYTTKQNVPWGISECASSERVEGEYRYHAFGVPDLALRTDGQHRLVIAPYASVLALMIDPKAATANLKSHAAAGLLARCGFYEAVDHTSGATTVRSYMAHHQGMSLVALGNVLHHDCMQERFHRDLMVQATELLLHERPSRSAPVEKPLNPAAYNQASWDASPWNRISPSS